MFFPESDCRAKLALISLLMRSSVSAWGSGSLGVTSLMVRDCPRLPPDPPISPHLARTTSGIGALEHTLDYRGQGSTLLTRGEKARVFRAGVDPVELYI